MCEIHGPLIIPLFIPNLVYIKPDSVNSEALVGNIYGLIFYLILGFLLNARWIFTGISIIVVTVVAQLYFSLILEFDDAQAIISGVVVSLVCIYASFHSEKNQKESFVQLNMISHMNQDLHNLLTNMPDGIILYNPEDSKVVFCNQEFKNIFQFNTEASNDEVTLKIKEQNIRPYTSQFHTDNTTGSSNNRQLDIIEAASFQPEGLTFTIQSMQQSRQQNDLLSSHNLINNKKGNENQDEEADIVTFNSAPIYFQDKNLQLIMIRVMTQQLKYEKLKMENHFLEMLTATVSHDMRTPLNAIIGLLASLEQHVNTEMGLKFLKIIKSSSNILEFLVNDMLDYFQIKNGKFKRNETLTNLRQSITSLVEIFNIAAKEKGVDIICEFHESLPELMMVDEQRIRQVIMNLISNSFKFTTSGYIKISVELDTGSQTLKVNVKDTGVGIKTGEQQKLFVLFGKLEQTQKMNTTGIGLGLSICKNIVEAFDGEIHLENNQDSETGGASFTFTMKIQQEDESILSQHSDLIIKDNNYNSSFNSFAHNIGSNPEVNIHHEMLQDRENPITGSRLSELNLLVCQCEEIPKILIVDDNIFNIITLETIIEHTFELKCDRAVNGLEAVKKVNQCIEQKLGNRCLQCRASNKFHYQVIFMDCNMPIMDGFQSTSEIRKLEIQNNMNASYIVALTAYQTESIKQKCIRFGMNTFQTKPVDVQQLKIILENQKLIDT